MKEYKFAIHFIFTFTLILKKKDYQDLPLHKLYKLSFYVNYITNFSDLIDQNPSCKNVLPKQMN